MLTTNLFMRGSMPLTVKEKTDLVEITHQVEMSDRI